MTFPPKNDVGRLLRSLLQGTAAYGIGTLVVRSYTLLLLPVYLAYLTPRDFGILSVAELVSAPLVSVLNLCLDRSVTRYYHVWVPEERSAHLGAIWVAALVSAITITALLLLAGPIIFETLFVEVPFFPYLALACIIAALRSASSVPQMVLRAREEAARFATLAALTSLSGSTFIVLSILVYRPDAEGVLLATLLNEFVWFGIWSAFMWRWATLRSIRGRLGTPLRYSLPLLPADLIYTFGQTFDRVLLQRYVPLTELGLYSVAGRFGRMFHEVNQAAKNAWMPMALRLGADESPPSRRAIGSLAGVYVATFMVLAFVTAAFAREVLELFASAEYSPAAQWIPVFVAGYFGYVIYFASLPGINLSGRNEYVTWVMAAYAIVSVSLALVLIPRFGAFGAAVGFSVSLHVLGVSSALVSRRLYPVPFPVRATLILGLVGVVVLLVLLALPEHGVMLGFKICAAIGYVLFAGVITRRSFPSAQIAPQLVR